MKFMKVNMMLASLTFICMSTLAAEQNPIAHAETKLRAELGGIYDRFVMISNAHFAAQNNEQKAAYQQKYGPLIDAAIVKLDLIEQEFNDKNNQFIRKKAHIQYPQDYQTFMGVKKQITGLRNVLNKRRDIL